MKAFQVVAVCDCFLPRAEAFVKELSGKARSGGVYQDFRKMIAKEKLDGVMVETTTHARAWIVIQAMQAGLDVYIEKPMCLTIAEGRTMVKAARKYNRVTQVGTQQRSMPINNWASDLVKNGAIGKILTVIAPNFVGPFRWTKTSSKDVKGPGASRGGTCGRTRPNCGRTIPTFNTAGRAGGTTTAAGCASASPAGERTPTTRSTAPWAPTRPAPSR